VAWEARHDPDELSAIQHAMNLKLRDERAFYAEYQNEPLAEVQARSDDLTADQIAGKVNRMSRGEVGTACNRLTAMIDVQASLLFYVVVAWEDDFTGQVVDYGCYPDQRRAYFTLRDAKQRLAEATKAPGLEGQLYAGLEALTQQILGREWLRDDGAMLKVEKCLIDANWGDSTALIYRFARQSAHSALILPSHGKYVGAASLPMSEYSKRPGEKVGHNWRLSVAPGQRMLRRVIFDSNFWKSFVHTRLSVPMGSRGCLSIFGQKPSEHRLFADHLTAEHRVRTQGRGREVDEWKIRPDRPDNHWWDCLVGCAVAASVQGVTLADGGEAAKMPAKKRMSFKEAYEAKWGAARA